MMAITLRRRLTTSDIGITIDGEVYSVSAGSLRKVLVGLKRSTEA